MFVQYNPEEPRTKSGPTIFLQAECRRSTLSDLSDAIMHIAASMMHVKPPYSFRASTCNCCGNCCGAKELLPEKRLRNTTLDATSKKHTAQAPVMFQLATPGLEANCASNGCARLQTTCFASSYLKTGRSRGADCARDEGVADAAATGHGQMCGSTIRLLGCTIMSIMVVFGTMLKICQNIYKFYNIHINSWSYTHTYIRMQQL